MAKVDLSKPTIRGIQMLFRDLAGSNYGDDNSKEYQEYKRCQDAEEEIRARLLNVTEMRRAEKAKEDAQERWHKAARERREKIAAVRRQFYAKGLTPAVAKKIEELVDSLS